MSRSRQLFLPAITLDRQSASPLHRQISRQIEAAIRRGDVYDTQLPSSRVLARLLGVSRNTVLVAYDELAAGGFIHGRRGARMIVAGPRATGLPDLQHLLRDAQYPARPAVIADSDGNEIELNHTASFALGGNRDFRERQVSIVPDRA